MVVTQCTGDRPGRLSRQEALFRLLDALAAVPRRRRALAMRTLGLQLDRRDERFLLALIRIWEEAPTAEYAPRLQDGLR
jgi:hypothetical protein